MEAESRSMRMLLQSMPKKGFALTFIIFFVLFLIFIIVGAVGPYVYVYNTVSAWNCPTPNPTSFDQFTCAGVDLTTNNSVWTGEITNLDPLNQEIFLQSTLTNKIAGLQGVQKLVTMKVDIVGRNNPTDPWTPIVVADIHSRNLYCAQNIKNCTAITISHQLFVSFKSYRYNVSLVNPTTYADFLGDVYFTFSFVDHRYTLFEVWFRFSFLFISFCMLMAFIHQMRHFNWRDWSIEQKWVAALLFSVMGYDNPFYPLEIMIEGWFPVFLNRVLYVSFIFIILLFWLVIFDATRVEAKDRVWKTFYIPKIIILAVFWVAGVVAFTWTEMRQLSDPVYSTGSDLPGLIFFEVLVLLALLIYVFWLVYVTCRACGDMKVLPYLGVRLKALALFTFSVMLAVVCGLIFSGVATRNSAAEFLSYLALFNLYVYVLAFLYLPAKNIGSASVEMRTERIGMVRLEDDDDSLRKPSFN